MRTKQMIITAIVILLLAAGAGCKKTKTEVKNFAISAITDTAGNYIYQFAYTPSGKILQMFSSTASYDFLYSGDKLITRTYTAAGVYLVDSFFYDLSSRVFRIVEYDMFAAVKRKTTVFIFNADNTINASVVDYASVFTDDEIFNFTYTNGNYMGWSKLVNRSGSYYESDVEFEFLAYDDKPNPLAKVYRDGLIDQVELYPFFGAYPNNYTSGKQTNYDSATGLVSHFTGGSVAYTYNTEGLPVRMDIISDNSRLSFLLHYVQL